ncbi:hypothetical protein [Undibacterium sp. RuRC25W]|uniref:hypothetical protein n=1 Tax=Undibacterium sp. RuRC25W TaxID=3413047 RepID=UPI003BEFCDCF
MSIRPSINILNYELAPSPATIFGCLLPAPWLGALAGVLLAFGNSNGLPDRFAPLALALTHCLVLGMLAPIMIGALFQLMPVVAGQTVVAARYLAPCVALGSAFIAMALAVGFLAGDLRGFQLAIGVALPLYGAVIAALGATAWRISVVDTTTRTLRWIALAFLMVVVLGIAMAGSFVGWWHIDIMHFLDLHVAWGVLGWTATLVLGIASTTVPMFWQTVRPGTHWQTYLPGCLWLPLMVAFFPPCWSLALVLACLVVGGTAGIALYVVWHAKRRFDPTWVLWVVCAISWLCAALLVFMLGVFSPYLPASLKLIFPWWIGVLTLVGGAVLPINAMLGKIIPFLVFMHLRRQTPAGRRVPTMQAILAPQRLLLQARVVLLAFILLLLLPFSPSVLAMVAGFTFAASQGLLGILLALSLLRYRRELHAVLFPPGISDIPQKN